MKGVELGKNKSAGVEESVRAGGPNFAIVKKKFGEHVRPGNFTWSFGALLERTKHFIQKAVTNLGEAGSSTGVTDPQRKHSGKNRSQTLESKCPVG